MRKKVQLALPLAAVLSCSLWWYVQGVVVPHQEADAASRGWPRGNLSDLYPRWLGARELLLHGRDPYSAELTREIQTGYYGRPLDRQKTDEPRDEERFAYPVFVVFLLSPTIHLSFPAVQAMFLWIFVFSTAASVLLWGKATGAPLRWQTKLIAVILILGSWPVVQGLYLQQLSLVVSALLAATVAAVAWGWLGLAGILLACTAIKPQWMLLMACWLNLWAVSDWRRRWRFSAFFLVTMAVLLVASEFVLPGWFGRWQEELRAYMQYTRSESIMRTLLGRRLGMMAELIAILFTAFVGWRLRREESGTQGFGLAVVVTVTASVLVVPKVASYDQLFLLPAVLWLLPQVSRLRSSRPALRLMFWITLAALLWPWTASCALFAVHLASDPTARYLWKAPVYTVLLIPVSLAYLVAARAMQVLRFESGSEPSATGRSRLDCES
jgi:hypothetical protein